VSGPRDVPAGSPPVRGRAAAKLLLLLAALGVSLGGAELVLRLAGFSPLFSLYSKPSLFWQHDRRLGWVHTPGSEGVYVGPRPFPIEFEAPIHINSLGLRGPDVGPKEPGEFRVLFLGDSRVAAFEVAYEDTFVAILERRLKRSLGRPVRVINGGVRGYGTDQMLLYYTDRGRLLEADLVVHWHSGNDYVDNLTLHRARRPFGKAAFALRDDGSLELVGSPVPRYPACEAWSLGPDYVPRRTDGLASRAACAARLHAADRSALFSLAAQVLGRMPGVLEWWLEWTSPEAPRHDARGRAPVQQAGFGIPLVAPPDAAEPSHGYDLATVLVRRLAHEVTASGSRFVSVGPLARQFDVEQLQAEGIEFFRVITDMPRLLMWRNDPHMNERGHRWAADALLPLLRTHADRAAPRRR
jgi:hypothetical protein